MKKSDIYEVTIKILGIYLFYTAIGLLTMCISSIVALIAFKNEPANMDYDFQVGVLYISIGHFVITVLIAAWMTFKTRSIVKLVCRQDDYNESASLFADRKVIFEIALIIIGLLLIIASIPDFIHSIKNIMEVKRNYLYGTVSYENIIVPIVKIAIGLFAFINSRKISAWLARDSKPQ